ncbi:extracellular solute-binding protein [Leuconostoc lactis]|nr:extracellular solute-binding protein [Leuconostoc lactis]GHC26750.1 hypothetical protein GCM10008913_13350 [Leuconostoc lactis KCTC 3528 = DSM 20202]
MMKKVTTITIVCLTILAVIVIGITHGKTPTASANQRTTIVFWHSMCGKPAAALKQLVAKYNASQSKYTVVPEYQGAYTESLPKYLNVAQSSAAPAIVQAQEIATSTMLATKSTLPMNQLLTAQTTDQIEDNIARYYTVNQQLQAMPFNSSTPVLY